jgi:hypothetical protein
MGRTFSLATLLLVTAIVAAAVASIRSVPARIDAGQPEQLLIPLVAGTVAGGIFGIALALWQRDVRSFYRWRSWPGAIAAVLGGFLLGAAAGAHMTTRVDWWVIALVPPLVIGGAVVVAANRRRQMRRRAMVSPPSAPLEPSQGGCPPQSAGGPPTRDAADAVFTDKTA